MSDDIRLTLRVETDISFHCFCATTTFFMEAQRPSKQMPTPLVTSQMSKMCACNKGGINLCHGLAAADICLLYGKRVQAVWSCLHSPAHVFPCRIGSLKPPGAPVWLSPLTGMCPHSTSNLGPHLP